MRTNVDKVSKMGRKDNKEIIHSGHFMVSDFDAIEAQDEEEKEVAKYLVEIPDPDGEKSASDDEGALAKEKKEVGERKEKKVKLKHKNVIKYKSAASKAEAISIDGSLTKLFNAMDIAYKHKITSPKWNRFKGLKLRCKDKIRLNNVIWRCWHMQFILRKNMRVCQFALDVDMHNKPEAIVMEGKYWKRHLDTVTAEYKKWRIYYKNKLTGCENLHLPPDDQWLMSLDDLDWRFSPHPGPGQYSMDDDLDSGMDLNDILFTSLMNAPQPYAFPNPREIARTGNSDLLQPGLIQLQPNLDDFMDITEPWQEMLAGRGGHHSLPPVPEEEVYYNAEVEAAGLPPSTTHTPPSYSSTTTSSSSPPPPPSSTLDYHLNHHHHHPHHHQQARLTNTISSSSSSSAAAADVTVAMQPQQHDTSTQDTNSFLSSNNNTSNSYHDSSGTPTTNGGFTSSNSSSSNNNNAVNSINSNTNYPITTIADFATAMELGTVSSDVDGKTSSHDTLDDVATGGFNYTSCISFVPPTPPSPAAPSPLPIDMAHPPQITTPKGFPPHDYNRQYSLSSSRYHRSVKTPVTTTSSSSSSSRDLTTPILPAEDVMTMTDTSPGGGGLSPALGGGLSPALGGGLSPAAGDTSGQYGALMTTSAPVRRASHHQALGGQQIIDNNTPSGGNILQHHERNPRQLKRSHHQTSQQHVDQHQHPNTNKTQLDRHQQERLGLCDQTLQQQQSTQQQMQHSQPHHHQRIIVKSFSQQELTKLPSPPSPLSPSSRRLSPATAPHHTPATAPSRQESAGFAVPKQCPRRRSYSSGAQSSANQTRSSPGQQQQQQPSPTHLHSTPPHLPHLQAAPAHLQSSTGHLQTAPTHLQSATGHLHSAHLQSGTAHLQSAPAHIQSAPAHIQSAPAHIQSAAGHLQSPTTQLQYRIVQQQQPPVVTLPCSTSSWSFLPTTVAAPAPVTAVSTAKLIAPATSSTNTSQPGTFFSQLIAKGEPSDHLLTACSTVAHPHQQQQQLVFGTTSPITSSQSHPVKLSFVFPNLCPPALIPLTNGSTLTNNPPSISLAPLTVTTAHLQPKLLSGLSSGDVLATAGAQHLVPSSSGLFASPASTSLFGAASSSTSVPSTLPNVTLSPVTPSSLKSIHQAQLLFTGASSSTASLPCYSSGAVIKSSPPHSGPPSPLPSPPNKAFRPKNDHERVQYREHRRVCHINAEKKRRCSIKSNFETLHSLIPSVNNSPNSKISKAALLHKGADYIQQLKSERQQLADEVKRVKHELEQLSGQISHAQSQLPATGAPMTHSRHNKLEQMYHDYVRERTLSSWKFYIFSMLGQTLLETYNANVSTASVEDLSRSALAWLDQHCSLNLLRPVVSKSMLQLSTTTSVLAQPHKLPEDIYNLIAKQEEMQINSSNNNNSSGSNSSSRSSSLVRQ